MARTKRTAQQKQKKGAKVTQIVKGDSRVVKRIKSRRNKKTKNDEKEEHPHDVKETSCAEVKANG